MMDGIMTKSDDVQTDETLDPNDWDAMRALGHQMIDDMMTHIQTLPEQPVWKEMPQHVRDYFKQPLPLEPQPEANVYQDFMEYIFPYPLGNLHPRFWGWVLGTGTPLGALAEFLAAIMNSNTGGGNHAANLVEEQVLDWVKELYHFPAESSGLLVSGASMANLVGLTVARNTLAGYNIRKEGIRPGHRMIVYASSEVHSCMQKNVELLGMGSDSLRLIPTNDAYEIDIAALEAVIKQDRNAGLHPLCIVGNAGTVNTGAFDNLNALADIAARENMWFHVDGAFGSLVVITEDYHHLTAGMDRADSIAFDFHKWMYMPFEIGGAIVRHRDDHYKAFTLTPTYLTHGDRGTSAGEHWFSDYGVQLSRGFRALKAWMSLKNHGLKKYGRLIQQNIEQVNYLISLIENDAELEITAPSPINIACFRFVQEHLDNERLNKLNQEIIYELHERGIAVPSYAILDGIYSIRVANTNHRTRHKDFDLLVSAVKEIGNELAV
jgi:aromatic-L-amino-acid decarboxylase